MDLEPAAGSAELAELRAALRPATKSALVLVHNRSPLDLALVNASLTHGRWRTPPPATIRAFTIAVLASESDTLLRGTEFSLVYADELSRAAYRFRAANNYSQQRADFVATSIAAPDSEPADLSVRATEQGTAAEADWFVQRTVSRLRLQTRVPVSMEASPASPPVRP